MATNPLASNSVRSIRLIMLQCIALLVLADAPWPESWLSLRSVVASIRSPELNRAEREVHATGYYEGLIGGGEGGDGARGELALRLMGKPAGWVRFNDANVSRPIPGDFLQFELLPNLRRSLFGKPFHTNSHGMHSPEVSLEKPPGTFRIVVLGASMDMGWGVTQQETYSHLLEEWLNTHGNRHGFDQSRRFEVLNFAVAAYSPLQRLDTLRRKAMAFQPDLIIYSATMLDLRLMEIHLCDAFRTRSDLTYDFLKEALNRAGITPQDTAVDGADRLIHKNQLKNKLNLHYWDLYDATMTDLAARCRAADVPLLVVIVPRVGKADAPLARAEPVARLKAINERLGLPVYDLTAAYDRYDPSDLEIAAWDDHPNALGHQRLFLGLARSLAADPERYHLLFPHAAEPPAAVIARLKKDEPK